MTDEELLALYATGDVRGMEDLYHRHRAGLYSYIYNQARDRTVSDDIMQDVWSRLMLDIDRIVSMIADEALTFSLKAYLYRMARNRVIDHFRASGWLEELGDGETYLISSTPSPERVSSEAELYACLQRRMRPLRLELHDAFWLTRDGRMTYEQAATALNVATETVKDWVKQVLRAIRPCREEFEYDQP
jgi:RNA polymerase sigma-70 factor, ECF subfamily